MLTTYMCKDITHIVVLTCTNSGCIVSTLETNSTDVLALQTNIERMLRQVAQLAVSDATYSRDKTPRTTKPHVGNVAFPKRNAKE